MVKKSKQHGMTLIEVMVALVIFSVGLLALGGLQLSAIRSTATAKDLTEASRLLSDRVEQIMGGTWTRGTTDSDLTQATHVTKATVGSRTYNIQWVVKDSPAPVFKKTIDLTLSWSEAGKSHSFSQTLVKTMD